MNHLAIDLTTLLLVGVFVSVIIALCLSLLLTNTSICPGFSSWLASQWCFSFGLISIISRLWLPIEISIMLGNTLLSLALALILKGLLRYHNVTPKYTQLTFLPPLLVGLSTLFSFLTQASFSTRCNIFDAIEILQLTACVIACLYRHQSRESGRKLWALIFTIIGCSLLTRSILVREEHLTSLFTYNDANLVLLATELIFLIGSAICIPLITAQRLQLQLEQYAHIDQVTGLSNRHVLEKFAKSNELNTAPNVPHSLAILDIDHFKKINDTYGHQTGDKVLRLIAGLIESNTRKEDLTIRYGGEEFLMIFPEQSVENSYHWAERIRQLINSYPFLSETTPFKVTASIGLARLEHQQKNWLEEALKRADKALYQAKRNGRDQIQLDAEQMGV